ncbi:MAG: head GIN domain-containing protein [Flavobacteriales bacterium]
MKNIVYILLIIFAFSCDSENASDCFQTEGAIVQTEYQVAPFLKIQIQDNVSLIIKQDNEQRVTVETGENLLPDVSVKVEDETLIVKDNNGCNIFRDYGVTKVYVSIPNLIEIRNASTKAVKSDGVLHFPILTLISNSTGNIDGVNKSGDFLLQIEDCEDFRISANGQSVFYISGNTNKARINFADEWPRFEGENFLINDLRILQRSAAKMIVNPQEKITGEIRGTGDVIATNHPPIVEVEEFFTGKLIFQ